MIIAAQTNRTPKRPPICRSRSFVPRAGDRRGGSVMTAMVTCRSFPCPRCVSFPRPTPRRFLNIACIPRLVRGRSSNVGGPRERASLFKLSKRGANMAARSSRPALHADADGALGATSAAARDGVVVRHSNEPGRPHDLWHAHSLSRLMRRLELSSAAASRKATRSYAISRATSTPNMSP